MTDRWAKAPAPRHQLVLVPLTADDMLAANHPIRLLDDFLNGLDWRPWERHYHGHRGQPEALLILARRHWEIENCLHHAKDRSLYEDADRTKRGSAAMSRIRSVVVALLQCVPGASVPQKQLRIAARPAIALALLRRRRMPRRAR